jgi:hypothetical protein
MFFDDRMSVTVKELLFQLLKDVTGFRLNKAGPCVPSARRLLTGDRGGTRREFCPCAAYQLQGIHVEKVCVLSEVNYEACWLETDSQWAILSWPI